MIEIWEGNDAERRREIIEWNEKIIKRATKTSCSKITRMWSDSSHGVDVWCVKKRCSTPETCHWHSNIWWDWRTKINWFQMNIVCLLFIFSGEYNETWKMRKILSGDMNMIQQLTHPFKALQLLYRGLEFSISSTIWYVSNREIFPGYSLMFSNLAGTQTL